MKTRFMTIAATALLAFSAGAFATEAVTTTTTETKPTGEAAVTTTTVIPAPGQAAVAPAATAPPAVVVETKPASVPRDAITGEPVVPEAEKKEDESLRDKVRDKMKN